MELFVSTQMLVTCFLLGYSLYCLVCVPALSLKVGPSGAQSVGIDSLYASSLFRAGYELQNVPIVATIEPVDKVHKCLSQCLSSKVLCRAFNYSPTNGTCVLLAESLCANETYELTSNELFNYYDIMNSPEYERKHLTDQYCQVYGKCSGKCYPRSPLFVDKPMNRKEAFEHCASLGRKLAQPRSQTENTFYGEFGRKQFQTLAQQIQQQQQQFQKSKNKSTRETGNKSVEKVSYEKFLKEFKYWIGITDDEVEGFWIYDDGTPVSESFSAWSVSQPDNGLSFGSRPENCAAIEIRDYNWIDVNCELELYFFCA